MKPTDPRFADLRKMRANELVKRTGITEREALDLIDMLGLDRSVLIREAVILKKKWRVIDDKG